MNAELVKRLPFVDTCLFFEEIDSTNTLAKELAAIPAQGMHVLWAGRQRAGRGRQGRSFFSAIDGGLWVSVVVGIQNFEHHFHLNRSLSTAIADALVAEGLSAGSVALKWPNDIYVNDRKICGILLEAIPGRTDGIVAGFGLNVNIAAPDFPHTLTTIATSLSIETGSQHDCPRLLAAILTGFERYRHEDQALVHARYCQRLYRRGHTVTINGMTGIFHGVDIDGRIVLCTTKGMSYFLSGDVCFINP
jgi:BirA family biotin operon repressor/biotin-[acetyl-CoA-carboxylase] ligase